MSSEPKLNEIPAENVSTVEGGVALTLAQARLGAARLLHGAVSEPAQPVDKDMQRLCIDLLKLPVDTSQSQDATPPLSRPDLQHLAVAMEEVLRLSGRGFAIETDPRVVQERAGGGS